MLNKNRFISTLLLLALVSLSAYSQIIRYTTANINLRSAASTYSESLIVLPKGTAVNLSEECDCKWISVEYKGQIGYVSSRYLSKSRPSIYRDSYKQTKSYKTGQRYTSKKYYTNSRGERVQSPTHYKSRPQGATALCRDGTYSFSRSRRGTCSRHGGIAVWY